MDTNKHTVNTGHDTAFKVLEQPMENVQFALDPGSRVVLVIVVLVLGMKSRRLADLDNDA